jgi:hypothetical protein
LTKSESKVRPANHQDQGDSTHQQNHAQWHFPIFGADFEADNFLEIHDSKKM